MGYEVSTRIMKYDVPRSRVNKKADIKLDLVVKAYQYAMGAYCRDVDVQFMNKNIRFQGTRFLQDLNLSYKIENRFFAVSYDLLYETKCDAPEGPEEDFYFCANLKGKTRVTGVLFAGENKSGTAYIQNLNMPLITDRIKDLDLTDTVISYSALTAEWTIRCRSLIGSTTWTLIPPITQFVMPREKECVGMIELFELMFNAVLKTKQEQR